MADAPAGNGGMGTDGGAATAEAVVSQLAAPAPSSGVQALSVPPPDILGGTVAELKASIVALRAAQREAEERYHDKGIAPLAAGFLMFGSVLGVVTAASGTKGISQTLLTSLLTFVGGVLLTYTGFRIKKGAGETEEELSPHRVGWAVAALGLGIWVGLAAGVAGKIYIGPKLHDGPQTSPGLAAASPAAPSATPPAPLVAAVDNSLLQSGSKPDPQKKLCTDIHARLEQKTYAKVDSAAAVEDIRALSDAFCPK